MPIRWPIGNAGKTDGVWDRGQNADELLGAMKSPLDSGLAEII